MTTLSLRVVALLLFLLPVDSALQAQSFDIADSLFFAGAEHATKQHYHQAITDYRKALALKPRLALAWSNLGHTFCALERWSEAIEAYEKALALNLRFTDIYNNLGLAYLKTGRYEDARLILLQALQIRPDNTTALYNLGTVLSKLGRHTEALTCYQSLLKQHPNDTQTLINTGWTYVQLGNFQEAIRLYTRAVDSAPNNPIAHSELAQVLDSIGYTADAIRHYEKALSLQPDMPYPHYRLALLRLANLHIPKAIHHYTALARLDTLLSKPVLQALFDTLEVRKTISAWHPVYRDYIGRFAPNERAFTAVQRLAEIAIDDHEWDKAARIFRSYKKDFPRLRHRFTRIVALLTTPEESIGRAVCDTAINSATDECRPSLSLDESTLYFNRVTADYSTLYKTAIHLPEEKTPTAQQPVAIIPSTRAVCFVASNMRACTWSQQNRIEPMPDTPQYSNFFTPPFADQNSMAGSDGSLSADGSVLLYVQPKSTTSGQYKPDTDIYIRLRTDTGWSSPIHLGDRVNTPFAERTPFLHPDGKTLYFSSEGHYSLGRTDVYKCVRLREDSWTEWSEPVNIGKEINTTGNDLDFIVSTTASVAYYTAEGSRGDRDIFKARPTTSAQPQPLKLLYGDICNEHDMPLTPLLHWFCPETGKTITGIYDITPGRYVVALPAEHHYTCLPDSGCYSILEKDLPSPAARRLERTIIMFCDNRPVKGYK